MKKTHELLAIQADQGRENTTESGPKNTVQEEAHREEPIADTTPDKRKTMAEADCKHDR